MLRSKVLMFVFAFVFLFMHVMLESASETDRINLILNSKDRTKRAVIRADTVLWNDAIIPYDISWELYPNECLIESSMLHIMMQTCVYFRPRQFDHDRFYVSIRDRDSCSASIGQSHSSRISLGTGCHSFKIVLHELIHVLGFRHEHTRSDRDQYLKINHDNIKNIGIHNFRKQDRSNEQILTEFDFDSIMLYASNAFSINRNNRLTIESRVPGKQSKLDSKSEQQSLSCLDVKAINELYKCPAIDNKACNKLSLLDQHFTNCGPKTRKYIDFNLVLSMIKHCRNLSK